MSERYQKILDQMSEIEEGWFREYWATLAECSDILRELSPSKGRKVIGTAIRELHRKQGGKCALCGESVDIREAEVDHIIPFCYGGGNERGNIQLAHGVCNRSKGAQVDPDDLLRYLEDRAVNL